MAYGPEAPASEAAMPKGPVPERRTPAFSLRSLRGDRAFQRLRRGRPGSGKLVSTKWLPNNEAQVRVGIVVSKKVGKAVVRNLVRRRLREALRAILAEAELNPRARHRGLASFDLVVIARPEAAAADYAELRGALARALARGQLLA